MAEEVGVRELRDHLSRWLAQVAAGVEVIVTDRGRPVARLVAEGRPLVYQELVERGVIHPAARTGALPKPVKGVGGVSELLARWR